MIKKLLFGILTAIVVVFPQIIKSQVGVGPAPYCMPLYNAQPCNSPFASNSPGNGVNDFIHSYNTAGGIVNITNNNSGCNAQNLSGIKNYRLWGCEHYLRVTPGQFITSNFQSGITFPQGCAVFVDWNNDGVYNAAAFTGAVPGGERVTQTTGVPPAAIMTPMPGWTVPNVPMGVYRMRVRCAYATSGAFIQPCTTYGFGETEEYFVYVNTSPSTMTLNLTSNSPVCIGNVVQINAQILTGTMPGTCTVNTFTYSWTGPMNFTSSVLSPTFTATNVLQSGVYTLNVTPPNGCGCSSSNTIQIWVNPNPSTSISNNGPVCQGSSLNFSNTINGSGTLTYTWTGPNNFVTNTPTISFASAQPSNTGVYNFTVSSSFPNGGTCRATSTSSAAVVPVAQVSVISTYTQCQGTNINLNATVNGATSYSWTGPNSFTSSLSNPILTSVTPLISGNYSVTTYFSSNQTTLVCSSSAVSNVSVVPMNPVLITPAQNVCQGATVVVSATAASNPTYSWNGPNTINLQQQSLVFNGIQPFVSGTYSVNAIWSIGTVSCVTSNVTNVNVVPVSTVNVVPNITICNGEGTNLTASAPGAVSYTWAGPNNFVVTQPNTQFQNLNPSWSGIYTVTAAFTSNNLTCYSTNQTNLLVKPNIQFSLNPVGILCFNQSLNVFGPNGATSYTWTGPNFNSNTQNLNIPNTTNLNTGTYSLTVDLNGCKTYGSVYVDVQNPIIWKNLPANLTICKGDSFTLTAEAGQGSGNYAYNWTPYYNITGPTGSVQTGVGVGTTYYNISVYDVACPQYTINHSFVLNVNSAPKPQLNLDKWQGCEPFCNLFKSNTQNTQQIIYQFDKDKVYYGDNTNICLTAGNYSLNVTTIGVNGCKEIFPQTPIVVHPKPSAYFHYNVGEENFVTFTPSEQKMPVSHLWDFHGIGQSTDKSPIYQFENQDNYVVTLLLNTDHDCKDTTSKVINVVDEIKFFIPNAFTPNGDGNNDIFTPKGLGIKTYNLEIFDRWGEMVFQSSGLNKGWDGTFKGALVKDDVYVYKIEITDQKGQRYTRTGHVTLMK